MMAVVRNRYDCSDLPSGWSREEIQRKSGLSAGKTDIYYFGPDGRKFRSKPQIARELGPGFDLSTFDFRSGKMIASSKKSKSKKSANYDYSKGLKGDASLTLPMRQTASIFKQPVTIVRSHPDSKSRHDLEHGSPDSVPPRQLFWEKSLSGLRSYDIDEEVLKSIDLPSNIQGIGPDMSTENLLQSIAAALQLNVQPVVGQAQAQAKFLKDPTVHVNTNQPLIQQVLISEDDVKEQELKVNGARKKLEEVLGALREKDLDMDDLMLPDGKGSDSESEHESDNEDNNMATS